jgi:hypothetical protein
VYMKPHKELEKHLLGYDDEYFKRILEENSPATYQYLIFISDAG